MTMPWLLVWTKIRNETRLKNAMGRAVATATSPLPPNFRAIWDWRSDENERSAVTLAPAACGQVLHVCLFQMHGHRAINSARTAARSSGIMPAIIWSRRGCEHLTSLSTASSTVARHTRHRTKPRCFTRSTLKKYNHGPHHPENSDPR